jgi:NhaA family Na+:H+ antiporter
MATKDQDYVSYDSPRQPIEKLLRPFHEFARLSASGGILLLICTVVALIWANSGAAESYHHLWEKEISFGFDEWSLSKSLHHWINDGLMAIFFFVVGLEIKREMLVGELASMKQAALPVMAAVGGMVLPASIYAVFNATGPGASGWGIPMATDIAFALGILALLGKRAPFSLKVFLAALAIADDLGAVLVIALFYTSQISWLALAFGAIFLGILVASNLLGVRHPLWFALLGLGLWLAFLKSGVHATVAGVLLAMTIPARPKIDAQKFYERSQWILGKFKDTHPEATPLVINATQQSAVHTLEKSCEEVETPMTRFEHALQPWVSFFIMPVFALANAGVHIEGGGLMHSFKEPIGLGIFFGLVLGKPVGIFFFSWLSVKLKFASLPPGITWMHIFGAGMLGGIGFTMSLFITNLAFAEPTMVDVAKFSILKASLVASIVGLLCLYFRKPGNQENH